MNRVSYSNVTDRTDYKRVTQTIFLSRFISVIEFIGVLVSVECGS